MRCTALAAALAAVMTLGVNAASAGLVKVTLTGSAESVNDFNNVFGHGSGTPGQPANLTDLPFVETFVIDTDADSNPFAPPSSTSVSTNSIFGASPPFAVSGALSIGGSDPFFVAGGNYSSVFITAASGGFGPEYQITSDDSPGLRLDNAFSLDLSGMGLPSTITQPVNLDVGSGTSVGVFDSFTDETAGGYYPDAIGNLYPDHLVITPISAAPEADVWVLLVIGVGLAGCWLRSKRETETAST